MNEMSPAGLVAARRVVDDPLVSIIVPVFNEQDGVGAFVAAVQPHLARAGCRFEILFVNDGSRDATLERLCALMAADAHIRTVNLSRNFGKEAALTAGLDFARGDVVIPIDVDLQDPPELIPRFLERWREGYDVVYGVRHSRASDTVVKRTTARWFYRLFNRLAAVPIPENVGDFRLLDRRVVEVIRRLPERNRFMKGLFAWVGFRAVGVPYVRPEREAGTSKWNYAKLWNFAWDGIVGFSSAPLKIWAYIGGLIATLAFIYAIFIVVRVLVTGVDIPGYASLITVILFLGGIQLLSLGILGEYIARLFLEVKGRPVYVVEGLYERPAEATPDEGEP